MWICIPCDKVFNGMQLYKDHLNSKSHRDKEEQNKNSQVRSEQNSFCDRDECIVPSSLGFRCLACNIYLNSSQQAEQHKNGEKHIKMRSKMGDKGQSSPKTSAQTAFTSHDAIFNEIQQCKGNLNSLRPENKVEQNENCFVKSNLCDLDDCFIPFNSGFRCLACKIDLNSLQQAEQHKSGEKHQKMRRVYREQNPSQTSISNSIQQFKYDLNSDKHGVKLEQYRSSQVDSVLAGLSNTSLSNLDMDIIPLNSGFKCTICEKYLNSTQQVEQHIKGESHKKMKNKTGFRDQIPFKTYDSTTSFDSPMKFDDENVLVKEFHDINIQDMLKDIKIFNMDEAISFEKSVM